MGTVILATFVISVLHSAFDFVWFLPSCLTVTLVLAACGADDPPEPVKGPEPGIRISGEAKIGVSGTL